MWHGGVNVIFCSDQGVGARQTQVVYNAVQILRECTQMQTCKHFCCDHLGVKMA